MSEKIALALTATVIVLLVGIYSLYQRNQTITEQAEKLEQENSAQTAIIASQSLDFQKYNEIARQASQQNTANTAQAQEKEIEYRTILKREKTCDLPVPTDIAGGLLDYANRLRASAMRADASGTNATGTGTTTASQLTYCQAVLWINPLLAAIEQANTQLAGIRQIESSRASQ